MIIDDSESCTTKSYCSSLSEASLSREDIMRRISKKRLDMSSGELIQLPPLNCKGDLTTWVAKVEEDLMAEDVMIPRHQWADAAIVYLAEPLNMLMRQQRARRMEVGGEGTWVWEDFQASLSQVLEGRDSSSGLQNFRKDHPIAATAVTVAGAGMVAAGSMVLAPAILVGGLNAVGFTASGVAGGSIAAGIQSSVYGGLTTGLFSTCQSIGATWAVGSGSAIVSAIGSLVAGATVLSGVQKNPKTSESSSDRPGSTGSKSTSPPPY